MAKGKNLLAKSDTKVNERELPRLDLNEDDLAAIKGWNVGGKYIITLEVEQVSMHQGDKYGPYDGEKPDNKVHASFKVLKAKTDNGDDFEKGMDSDAYKRDQ